MIPRFSKLKKRVEALFAPGLDMKVYCTVYHVQLENVRITPATKDDIWFS